MRAAIVTNCTNRKAVTPPPSCVASRLRARTLEGFAHEWRRNLSEATERRPAGSLYLGRGFLEARNAWESARARFASADFYIVSAGLGLVSAEQRAPAYSITASPSGPDSVVRLLGLADATEWWGALTAGRRGLAARFREADLVALALSTPYLHMLRDELRALTDEDLSRLRLITRADPSDVDPRLRPLWMPYDNRLNGAKSPNPGTESDFAQRALRHFVEEILVRQQKANAETHAAAVKAALRPLSRPARRERARMSDEEIISLMRRIGSEIGAARMLRVLRDEKNVACEQSRCSALFKEAFGQSKQGRTAA